MLKNNKPEFIKSMYNFINYNLKNIYKKSFVCSWIQTESLPYINCTYNFLSSTFKVYNEFIPILFHLHYTVIKKIMIIRT